MLQRPNFCCSCGEKIDRIEWHLWTSRRFCELCQTEHQLDDWLPRIIGGLFLLVGLFGVGSSFRSAKISDDLVYTPVRLAVERAEKARSTPVRPSGAPDTTRNEVDRSRTPHTPADLDQSRTGPDQAATGAAPPEPVFLCGAETKKGTACTRRVKGGGRCWQHAGREAVLPQEELAVPSGK